MSEWFGPHSSLGGGAGGGKGGGGRGGGDGNGIGSSGGILDQSESSWTRDKRGLLSG